MQAFPYDLFPRNCSVLVLAAQRLSYRLEQTSAQRLFLIINLLCLNVGPLPATSPDAVQVKLVSVLPLIKGSCMFYLETGACHAFCACGEMPPLLLVWINGQRGSSSALLPQPRGALPRGRAASMEVAKHQEASPGLPMSDSLTHGRAVSGVHLRTLAANTLLPHCPS